MNEREAYSKRYELANEIKEIINQEFQNRFVFEKLLDIKNKDDEYYLNLKIFKYVFSLGEKGQIFLWNEVYDNIYEMKIDIDKADYNKDEIEFFDEIIKTLRYFTDLYGEDYSASININANFMSDRLLLCPFDDKLNNSLLNFFDNNHLEYENYYCKKLDSYELHRFIMYQLDNLAFAILDKTTKEFYGYVKLDLMRNDSVYNIEYFIFPKYRSNGFAKEAIDALIKRINNKGIYKLVETIKEGVLEKKKVKIKCIEARIHVNNIASIKIVESLGFIYNGILPFSDKIGEEYIDSKIYDYIF